MKYKVEYIQSCGLSRLVIFRRVYMFFGLIPIDWEIVFHSCNEEDLFNWIDDNITEISERIRCKIQLNDLTN